ncbi:CinA family protein [Nocardiopsis alkaliphila]|uniref:CinA family protein n=1 Tax=Nocardiopsis alkaliphila TaxID=225762 RepID=UPI00034C540A|nr:nicotinamide-nucleotide amidohydrolase family protein [Nocardiopsis alkaliphila]
MIGARGPRPKDVELEKVAAEAAEAAHAALLESGATCATAESLTGGLIGAHLTSVPGASATYRGGFVTYATETKGTLLGVPEDLLAEYGAVHPDVAAHMARGARRLTDADHAVAVTGVAGPEPQDGHEVGTVFVALAGPDAHTQVHSFRFTGDRAGIRYHTVEGALRLLMIAVRGNEAGSA